MMNVVYYSSDFFAEMCGVAIQSLCECNTSEEEICIYVVEDHISNLNKERLKSVVDKYHRKLVFIKMPSQEEVYPGVTVNLGRTYARMALGEILPKSVDRVLSLDSDTLVMDSLHEMYNVEFAENEYVAGVYDCVGQAIQKKVLHVPDDLAYCNAGVFLIDLNKWRAENVGQKLLESVLKNADGKHIMYFLEQDLMNLTFYGHLKVLNPRYNMITSVYYFDYDEVIKKYDVMMDWLAHLYVGTLNMIHYMHDKYYYEAAEMALIDTDVRRTFATGIAGFSHVVDSLSAIKYAKVKAIRDEDGITTDFVVEGDFPRYGNDDDRADEIATTLLSTFLEKLKHIHTYRDSKPTTSILTITSNVVYGKATGSLPDGRKAGEPLSPGANPSYGAEQSGLLASLNSVAKLPYELALDGISNTQTINPGALGHSDEERKENLAHVLDGYFDQGAHHLNVNVFDKDLLIDAMEHPEKYPQLTIRVSGYAVNFVKLTREQQLDVISRTINHSL